MGIPAFHAYDEAVEMLYRIQQRSPGSQLAERALLRTANYYFSDQQYDFAATRTPRSCAPSRAVRRRRA
jgi:outer membrane protein assembly factor BamD (BamD/ComL family)